MAPGREHATDGWLLQPEIRLEGHDTCMSEAFLLCCDGAAAMPHCRKQFPLREASHPGVAAPSLEYFVDLDGKADQDSASWSAADEVWRHTIW